MADEILSDEEVFGGGAAAPQPQPAPVEDGLLSDEDVFGGRDDALRTTLRATTRASAGRDPALVAESERLARKYGLPVDTAERQIDTLRTQEELAQVDTFAQQAPKVAEWMASDPNAAALAKDDRDGLSALEQAFILAPAFRRVVDMGQSLVSGVVSGVGSAVSGGGEALNMGGRNMQRMQESGAAAGEAFWRLFSDDLGDRYAANVQAQRDMLPDWVENPFGTVGGGLRTAGAAIEGFAQENIAVDEDRQNLATDIASGLGSLGPYLAAAYLTGGAGVLGLGATQGIDVQADRAEAAGTYGTASSDAGQALGATVTAVTERMGLGWLMRRLPPGAKATLNKRVADILMGGAGEAAQEMTESAVQDVITKTLVDESFDPFQGLSREGLAAFGVGLLFRGGVHVARMEADAQQAEVEAETLGNIEAAIGNLKLAELSPERLREVLGRLKNSSVSDVFMPVDRFTALFQSEQELGAALDATGVDRAELSLALADNGQVRIPIEGYFAGMTPEQRAAAKPHARLTPAAMTPEEAKSFDREQALREFIEATGEQGRPANDPTNWVYEQVRAQLEAAGTDPAVAEQQAELYAAALRTAIVRSGLSLEQLAGAEQDPRLTIRRDTPDAVRRVAEARNADAALDASIEALRSGRLFTDREVNGARLAQVIRSKGGIDPESFGAGDLRAQDAQRRGLLRRGGMTVEQALELAIDSGFIQRTATENAGEYDANGADINTLLGLLTDDLGSNPVFSPEGFNVDRAAFNEATNELGRMLDELGIGREQLAEMDNAAVRAVLGMNGPMDAEGIEFDQAAPTDSQAFRDWFQQSKVANPDGTPLVVYHGTGEEFEAFDKLRLSMGTGHSSSGLGFYFTPSRRSAEGYAEKASNGVPADAVLLEVYLSIQNPYTMTLEEAQSFEDAAEAAVTRMMLQSQGYDGVWIPEQNAWVAFEPTQVKSIHNRGTWSRKDPRMLYQSVFHGSPHRGIEQTGFSLQKIGTGEGAQAYGWGLYFAGKREIAEWYRKNLSRPDVDFGDLKPAKAGTAGDRILRHLIDKGETFSREFVASFVPRESLSSIPFDEDGDVSLSALIDNNFGADDFLSQGGNKAIPFDDGSGLVVSDDGDIKAVSVTQGQLYAAEIPDDGDLLDYDATLDQQPDKVREALKQAFVARGMPLNENGEPLFFARNPTGQSMYAALGGIRGERAASEALLAAGIPGLRYLDGTSRGAGDGSRNYVIWDEGAISDVRTFYQSQPGQDAVPPEKELVAIHNLSAENLLFADKLGGLAVPSIGVTKADTQFAGFGDITLIGRRDLATPSDENPVFSADAYTQRFPDLIWSKVPSKKANAFVESFGESYQESDTGQFWDDLVNNPNRDQAIYNARRSSTMMRAWIKEQGETPAARVTAELRTPTRAQWAKQPAFVDAIKSMAGRGIDVGNARPGDEAWSEISRAAMQAMEAEAQVYADKSQQLGDQMREAMLDNAFEDGELFFSAGDAAVRYVQSVDKPRGEDNAATRRELEKQIGERMPQFEQWVAEKIAPLFDPPKIMVGKRKVEMTLENVVEAMTASRKVAGKEKTMTFSGGQVKAANAKQFQSLDEIKAARDMIVSPSEEKAAVDAVDKLMDQYRTAALRFFTQTNWRGDIDTWAGLDASMKALADAAKKAATPANVRAALQKNGFRGMDAETIELGVQALQSVRQTVVDYFEAKPQRAVSLSEFAGAVIPSNAPQEVRDALARAGVPVAEYDRADGDARRATVARFARELNQRDGMVLFQSEQQRTPEFQQWFDGSQVVDEKGEPLVVYHGSDAEFDVFDRKKSRAGRWGKGFYFTTSREEAAKYGKNVTAVYLKADRLTDTRAGGPGGTTVGKGKFWAMKGKLTAGGGDVYMVTDPRQIKAVTNERPTSGPSIYNQQLDDTKRGSVNIIPGYPGGLDRYLITLGNRADKSTFLHESAHVFLELRKQINAQVAAIPEAERTKDQQRIVEDDARLLEHLGVDSFDAIQRDQHEAFAESFEAYLREGKAPSPRLKRAFQSFRMWLTRIYRTLKGLPNANLTDEVRGYFDRMLATDEEIDAVRSQLSLQPIITEALRGDMSEDEYRRYLLAVETARQSAIEQEGAVQFTYAKREAERLRSAEMKELRAEVEAEINADPVWRAIAMLRTGKTPDGQPLPENEVFKFDTQAVTDLQGKEWVKKNLAGMHRREGGVHPDMAASVLGFKSAIEMLQAIASKPAKRDAIEAEALRRWQERNPDPLLDGALEARVTKALHTDAAAEVMVREINALYGNKGLALAPLREYVERTVAKMAVRNLNPNRHKAAEMRHGRAAFVAAAKGDRESAAQARRSQLMAHLSYRAELDAKDRAEAFRAEGVRLSKKPAQERLARAGWEGYLDKVNQILASFDLRRMSNKDIERKKSLRAWVEAQQEAGEITALSEELIARVEAGRVTNWREATVAEIDAAADALANIQHLAKIKNKLTAARDGREWDEARTDLLARMQESLPDTIGGEVSARDVGDVEQARRGVAGALANLNRPENVIEALDGGEAGPWHDYVWTVLQDAENKAVGYRKELGTKLKAMRAEAGDVFKTMQDKVVVKLPNERGQAVDVTVSRATLIGIALNTGNGTNMQRLVDGGIVSGSQRFRLGPQNVQQLLSELRSDELAFVQGMWDTVNSLWPDIVNLQRRMSGLPPEKVEARELTVAAKDGKTVTLSGGYWPLVYDSNRSVVGETQDGADAMRMMMGAGFTKAFTPKGYQKSRVETFEAPLQLDFAQVMSRHMDHVITDLSHREAVRDINRILSDSEIKENLILRVGREGYDNLRGSLSYAVSASSAVAGRVAARWARGLDTVMANTSVAALAIRPDIALGNLTSATIQGLDRVGVKALMRGWWALETSRTKTTEVIVAKSAFMAQRLGDTDYFFQQELQRLAGSRGWGPAYRRMMMALHRAADAEVTRALWWGRYQQALDAGEGESQAVLLADKAIRQTQTASGRKDISTFERDTQFKQARQFMGPMFVIFGRLYAAARGEGATQRVGARTSTLLVQVFLAPAIFALAAGRGPEDGDDDEEIGAGDWARWLAVNVGLFPIMTLPYLRDLTAIGEAVITGGQANPRANPTTQAVVSMGRAFQSLGQNAETYGETGEIDYLDATRDIFSILGPLVGAPASQVRITTKTIESVLDDPEQGKVEMAKMAVYGPPRETR